MRPVVLFRKEISIENEFENCEQFLPTFEFRSQIPKDSLVIGRYSALPYYQELESELALNGSKLINTYAQHKWVADLMDWGGDYGALKGLTPRTWVNWARLPDQTSFVLKGRTNSRKQQWKTHMFAETKEDVPVVARRLLDDSLIQDQGVIIREYVPLKSFGLGLNELPITNEWRTFWLVWEDQVHCLGSGFYWEASHSEYSAQAYFADEGKALARKAAELVAPHVGFFVLDVAETQQGDWIVVEVNDGQMSGPCGVNTQELYQTMNSILFR